MSRAAALVGRATAGAPGGAAGLRRGAAAVRRGAARLRRPARIVALLVLVGGAICLPFRPEWAYYREDVPATHTRTVPPGRPAVFQQIRWTLLRYGRAELKPGDLPPDLIGWPVRPGETLVTATLRAEPLTRNPRDFDIDYSLRDHTGHRWSAFEWHTTIIPGGTDPAYVMGLVPDWAVGTFELVMRHQHQDLSPALGGPQLVFRR
ncbi:hypothetical protein GCM10023195_53520 [Actinoallomurus liliacearum]|uniref:Uncharacterized protein n=1 Tax=Actinoallomurus liliacearum TaxID=1080073 RepID=A0ABP8TNP2_9ACTN